MKIDQDGEGTAFYIDSEAQTSNGIHVDVRNQTSGTGFFMESTGSVRTTGNLMEINSNDSNTNSREILNLVNDNAAAIGTVGLRVQQDALEGVVIDHNLTRTTSSTATSLLIDFDATGITASGQTQTNIGLDLDMNSNSPTMVGTVVNTGIDLDMVAGTSGTQTNVGMNIAVSGADTNYALITSGGNVGIGTATPVGDLQIGGDTTAARKFTVGRDVDSTTADAGITLQTAVAGDVYFDSKLDASSDKIFFRYGEGAEEGHSNTWMTVHNGNVGIGVAPETSHANYTSLQLGGLGNIINTTAQSADSYTVLSNNAYIDATPQWEYIVTDEASLYKQTAGVHTFSTVASGSADAAITWTDNMKLDINSRISL